MKTIRPYTCTGKAWAIKIQIEFATESIILKAGVDGANNSRR